MRKSELKRGKAMKRTALKPKRKKKKRKLLSDLAKRKRKMDSPYYNRKCSEVVTAWAHKQRCIMSGKREPETRLVCGHHLIRKSCSRLYRWHPMNIIPLSEEYHLKSIVCAAHSDNPLAVAEFVRKLNKYAYEHYEWLIEHQSAIRKTDMRDGPIERPDWKAQFEYWCKELKQETQNVRQNCNRIGT